MVSVLRKVLSAGQGRVESRPGERSMDPGTRTRTSNADTEVRELTDTHEHQANRFASEFLALFAMVAPMVQNAPSLLNPLALKQKWGISQGALLPHFLLAAPRLTAA